jgi:heme/copper-type cytochrome/quinol oxidase subunit 2
MGISANVTTADGIAALIVLIISFILLVLVVVAYFMSISMMVKVAKQKGCPWGSGKLWFIGLFTTPIVLGIIVAALPDRG